MKTKMSMIDHLYDIHDNQKSKRLKFVNGSILCDIWTASVMLCVHKSINDANRLTFEDKIKTKEGFIQMANFSFKNTKPKN
jgi:hypothetical protein